MVVGSPCRPPSSAPSKKHPISYESDRLMQVLAYTRWSYAMGCTFLGEWTGGGGGYWRVVVTLIDQQQQQTSTAHLCVRQIRTTQHHCMLCRGGETGSEGNKGKVYQGEVPWKNRNDNPIDG